LFSYFLFTVVKLFCYLFCDILGFQVANFYVFGLIFWNLVGEPQWEDYGVAAQYYEKVRGYWDGK